MGLLVSMIELFWWEDVVNDWDCVWFGLVAGLLKFWPAHWFLHLCLGCVGPLIGFVHGVNGRVVAWGSMIRAVGDND